MCDCPRDNIHMVQKETTLSSSTMGNLIKLISKYFLISKHIEQEKVDCQLGIEPGSLDYMPSVIPLDHQQSCFSMLFNSQLRVLHCPIYDLDNLDACALHAKYYGMCMCITLLSRRCSCACTLKWSTIILPNTFSFALSDL